LKNVSRFGEKKAKKNVSRFGEKKRKKMSAVLGCNPLLIPFLSPISIA